MNHTTPKSPVHLIRRVTLASALVLSATLATTAYTRDAVQSVHYACEDGDRFSVEYRGDQVRVRHGIGVFALSTHPDGDPNRFSDGNLVLISNNGIATLKHAGPNSSGNCRPVDV